VTSTLAKGIGCAGGFLAARGALIDVARVKASAYVCTTPASPVLVAASTAALRLARSDDDRRERLMANIRRVERVMEGLDLSVRGDATPIFAFVCGSAERMERMSAELLSRGVFVPLVTYPGGPCPVYFRLSVSSEHTDEQIDLLGTVLRQAMLATQDPGVSSVHGRYRSAVDA
jgi:7-keto-8-aminopelargonate synthetase-like enzyme